MHRNPDRITKGRWNGCGHEVSPYFTCDDPACFASFYAEYAWFLDTNTDALCLRCWRKQNGFPEPPTHPTGGSEKNMSEEIKTSLEAA